MKKLKLISFAGLFLVFGCGTSEKDKTEISQITCNVIEATRNMDAAQRIKEVSAAREQMGQKRFLGADEDIRESVRLGICINLVRNDENYAELLNRKRKILESVKLDLVAVELEIERQLRKDKLKTQCLKTEKDNLERIQKKQEGSDFACKMWADGFVGMNFLEMLTNAKPNSTNECYDVSHLRDFSRDELTAYHVQLSETITAGLKICGNEIEDYSQKIIEITSSRLAQECQNNFQECHEDWVAEN